MINMLFRQKEFPRMCFFASTYSLLLYLLYSSKEEILNTFFVFSETFPKEVAQNFENYCYIPKYKELSRFYILKKKLISNYYKLFHIPKIRKKTEIFCQDHTTMLQCLIGNHPYTLVAENPIMEGILKTRRPKVQENLTVKEKISQCFFSRWISPVLGHVWGYNDLCQAAIIADQGAAPYLKGKRIFVVDIWKEWKHKSSDQKTLIQALYGVDDKELEVLRSKRIIVFTQPFVPEMSLEEYERYMVAMINKYPHEEMVIKIHPRDELDYNKLFPDVLVCRLRIPSQLLDLLGTRFEKAVTYNSSAVYDFSYEIQIDWYGKDQRLIDLLGECPIPPSAILCHL